MRLRELGRTGVSIPEVGQGMWKYRGGPELLRKGIEAGSAFIDTAEGYGNEEVAGQAIKGIRDRVFVATKTHHWRRNEVLQCADNSLRRLGIERIDLYQIHWHNAAVPIEETMSAMEELVDQGKVRFIGVSNFSVKEFKQAQAALRKHKIVANQVRYSLLDRTIETELLQYCRQRSVTIIAYSPLGSGFHRVLEADRNNLLDKIARETQKTQAQVTLNWCLLQPEVVVISKTESVEHAVENCGASGWRLTGEHARLLESGVRFHQRSRMEIVLRSSVRGAIQRMRAMKTRIVPEDELV
jgi:diketogulonate reductase-like aldo/keto reductase